MKNDARFLSLNILVQFESTKKQLGFIQNENFSKKKYQENTKSRAKVLSSEVVKLKGRLDYLIENISGRKIIYFKKSLLSILRIGFYEILYDENIPDYAAVDTAVSLTKLKLNRKASGLTNAVLRNLIRKKESKADWSENFKKNQKWNSFPDWLQARWKNQFSKEIFLDLINSFNNEPETYIRNNTGKKNKSLQKMLSQKGVDSEIFNESFLKTKHGVKQILDHSFFKLGSISIQDPASYGIVECLGLEKGDSVLDVCAAPGTKSLAMSFLVGAKGKILSSDIDSSRVEMGIKDLKRNQLGNIFWSEKDATKDSFNMVDKILIDAPCSGTGVIRRKTDIKWRRKETDFIFFSRLQLKILCHISEFLKPGGILVYGTCSIEEIENWKVVEQFLNLNKNFSLLHLPSSIKNTWVDKRGCLSTIPDINEVDGMFAARLKKND